jgi:hypothetical protein
MTMSTVFRATAAESLLSGRTTTMSGGPPTAESSLFERLTPMPGERPDVETWPSLSPDGDTTPSRHSAIESSLGERPDAGASLSEHLTPTPSEYPWARRP